MTTLLLAGNPANAVPGFVNGNFETCDLTGWGFAPSEHGIISDVYPIGELFGSDDCSFAALDQAVLVQSVASQPGAVYNVGFAATALPLIPDIGAENIIDSRCQEPGTKKEIAGLVALEFVGSDRLLKGGAIIPIPLEGGIFAATTTAAPAGTVLARLSLSACPALGGLVFDDVTLS